MKFTPTRFTPKQRLETITVSSVGYGLAFTIMGLILLYVGNRDEAMFLLMPVPFFVILFVRAVSSRGYKFTW